MRLSTTLRQAGRTGLLAALCAAGGAAPHLAVAAQPPAGPDPRPVVGQYCVPCHNARVKAGGLRLDQLDLDDAETNAVVMERMARKLRSGLMPPASAARPAPEILASVAATLERRLDAAAARAPRPGRSEALHRLNRLEYRNAVRDLLAVDVDVRTLLPADNASYGFDNIAGVQRLSPALLERYLAAAERVSQVAVGTAGRHGSFDTTEDILIPEDTPQDEQVDGLPLGTRGGVRLQRTIPVDGEYRLRFKLFRLAGSSTDELPSFDRPQSLEVSVDGERVHVFTMAPQGTWAGVGLERVGGRRDLDRDWVLHLPLRAGPHEIVATFLNRVPALLETSVDPFLRPYGGADNSLYTTRRGAYLRSVQITGPLQTSGAGDTPSRRRIFTCRPGAAADADACAQRILSRLARRAYRRPVTADDVRPLLAFFSAGQEEGGSFDAGVQRALEALLVSPSFLFRIERAHPAAAPDAAHRVSDLELASRLSFFLWSSLPDEPLLRAAAAGTLSQPTVLDAQVRRMLADRRSAALVESFASQWLLQRNVEQFTPDPNRDPDFDGGLRDAFGEEVRLFFGDLLRQNRPLGELLTARETFVNERLARHYGIPGVAGARFRRVTLADDRRAGLLGKGGILAATSLPNRTSPVQRGRWILENLLGAPPPPPPDNVPPLDDQDESARSLSMRERMGLHRKNPVCASCHSMMDPLGLALENFDLTGRWRHLDDSAAPVDASGVLPDGTTFSGPAGLRSAILRRPDAFATAFVERLMTYALGRGVDEHDGPAVRRVLRGAAPGGYRLADLILWITRSVPFQMRSSAS